MSQQFNRSFIHLYKLTKVYSALGLMGVLIAALYGFVSLDQRAARWEQAAIWVFGIVSSLAVLWKISGITLDQSAYRLDRKSYKKKQ